MSILVSGNENPKGKDTTHISEMVDELKLKIKAVSTFAIVMNGRQLRLDHHLKAMLRLLT